VFVREREFERETTTMDPRNANDTVSTGSKCTCFDAVASSKADYPKTPGAMGANQIKQIIALLQPSIATILSKLGLDHLNLQAKARNKAYQVTRMKTDLEFAPPLGKE
jgi:hypothetical protein